MEAGWSSKTLVFYHIIQIITGLKFLLTFQHFIMLSMSIINKTGERSQHCYTPLLMGFSILTPWCSILFEKLIVTQLIK